MAERYPGGVISKTPPVITAPTDGEGGAASGMWTLDTVLEYEKAGVWPKPLLPRELYAWGANSNGQLGDNTVVNRSSPVQIGALTNWSKISGGSQHSAAIKLDGTLWLWGFNSNGQLGDGTILRRSSPVQIGALTNWSSLELGSNHSGAVKTDGTLWTWGNNEFGRLGHNNVTNKSSPVQVGALTDWSQFSGGSRNSAGIRSNGTLWTWGINSFGALGHNEPSSSYKSSPTQVGALTTWAKVSSGYCTFAIKTDGTLWAVGGINFYGTIGDGTTISRSSPVQVGALTNWSSLSHRADGLNCLAVKTDGTLWSWGRNNWGQAGLNESFSVNRSSPVQVGALTTWSQVSAGYHSAAVKNDGTLWTWGRNTSGPLGQNNVVDLSSPVQVGALTKWEQVSAGLSHTLAITKG